MISGIYCSGKTTLKDKLAKELGHSGLAFDNLYSYGRGTWGAATLAPVINALYSHERCVIDALPKLHCVKQDPHSTHDRDYECPDPTFAQLYNERECTVILVKCEFSVWLERLKARGHQWNRNPSEEYHRKEYETFYQNFDKWLEPYPYLTYNSEIGEFEDE